jgi:hypothetical protein
VRAIDLAEWSFETSSGNRTISEHYFAGMAVGSPDQPAFSPAGSTTCPEVAENDPLFDNPTAN